MGTHVPGLMDRLMGARSQAAAGAAAGQLKEAVARDLEDLLNTRAALPESLLEDYPECAASIINYGLVDFAGMCLSSSDDRARICASLKAAIERHEPRLGQVRTRIELQAGSINRVNFVISGVLAVSPAFEQVNFDAVLQPSTLHYAIHHSGAHA
ncbi:type VI secretion protein [Massilia sp. Root351]|jgi:type VI secretion system protein ImpF|uniref:type VI secretion system baseplate subunit TssE n=1 Tax=Massilia sp. Root351 TaxID=1736522 RepID=UPI00070CA4D8|nr:type VI secretion system baseplate subunit TssE [Massilia sp. Root351]KQV85031.1 type VI secretion protein [Massilia sp. Root351]